MSSDQVCFPKFEYTALQQTVVQTFIVPIAVELFLYGIFLGFYMLLQTLVFFTLATISISLDLAWRSVNASALTGMIEVTGLGLSSIFEEPGGKLQTGPYYIYFIAGYTVVTVYGTQENPSLFCLLLGLIGIFITWIVLLVSDSSHGDDEAAASAIETVYLVYVLITFGENLVLTGLMAGRVWWLDHRIKKMLIGGKKKTSISQSVLGPILQSGALNSIFLTIWVIINFNVGSDSFQSVINFLTPCALTQIVGIASTLIVVSIGISIGSDSQSHIFNGENRSALLTHPDHLIVQMQDSVRPSTDTVQPFLLKYNDQQGLSILSNTADGNREAQQITAMVTSCE
ncbi:hypothetical protein BDP27DRAFT_1321620 [Rhodocollybia butyracea]|uniref:Uncharacterized protein n=1 Tax=Rhodocollybia butyracea TaxID=206335 RepID=A0A9P5PY99_9AGAR|nr:hypothetical protein BDP27DRAFT_1321620 [Rhodocollybia butyracea]